MNANNDSVTADTSVFKAWGDYNTWLQNNQQINTKRQEVHASLHMEHIPILSYPYISIYGMSYPDMDM